MNTELEPELLLTKKMIAKAFGVTTRAVTDWDIKPAGKRGRAYVYYLPDVLDYKLKNIEANGSASYELTEERARLTHHQANIAAMDEAKSRGELIEVEKVGDVVGDEYTRIRARLLALPTKLAPQMETAASLQEKRDAIQDAIYECLTELSADRGYAIEEDEAA